MAVFWIEVDVALSRPIRTDATVFVCIESDSEVDATLTAIHMVCATRQIEMPTGHRVVLVEI
jgi:hypothetical protein